MLILDSKGAERFRLEGYLPKDEFRGQLELRVARVALMSKSGLRRKAGMKRCSNVIPNSHAAPEALYWKGVSRYKITNDYKAPGNVEFLTKKTTGFGR